MKVQKRNLYLTSGISFCKRAGNSPTVRPSTLTRTLCQCSDVLQASAVFIPEDALSVWTNLHGQIFVVRLVIRL